MLSVPGKVYGRLLTERLMEVTEEKVSQEQGGFRKGKGCVHKIFAIKMIVEEYLGKGRKLYAAFMDLEKAYDRVDREALWNVLRIYGVGGQLLEGIKTFYRGASACVRMDGEPSESFEIGVGVRQGCVMSPWLFTVFMDGCMRGRPLGRWKDRVREYLNERCVREGAGFGRARRECMDRERWRLFCRGHPLRGRYRRERAVRAID